MLDSDWGPSIECRSIVVTAVRPFRFGVQAATASSAADWTATARRAEELGYSALHLSDHYLGPGAAQGAQGLAATPAMAAAAAVTDTLRIGCRVLCVDFRVPVLAKEAATIDLLSSGRLELGLGSMNNDEGGSGHAASAL